jgi:hypothetical protein
MSKCQQCSAILGSKCIGPPIKITVAHRHFVLCPGCAVSLAENLYGQVKATRRAPLVVAERMELEPDLRWLTRGMD